MSKRHHASRRRAYGRRQHEVRERAERPARERFDVGTIVIQDIEHFDAGEPFDGFEGFDERLLDRLLAPESVVLPRSLGRAG